MRWSIPRAWVRFAISFVGAIVILPADAGSRLAAIAPADIGGNISVKYDIAFWGIDFGYTGFDTTIANNAYRSVSKTETTGLITLLWKADIDVVSTGELTEKTLRPVLYDSYYAKTKRRERVQLTFDREGMPTLFADPPYDPIRRPVSDEEKKGTLDPLSAIVMLMTGVRWDDDHPCRVTAPVYDGRRRYDIDISYEKDEHFKLDDGLFDGKAHLCKAEYRQISGPDPGLIHADHGKYPTMHAYVAEIPDASAPRGRYVVLLKAWSDFGWGTMKLTLSALKRGTLHDADKS